MYARLLRYVPLFLVSALGSTGCGGSDGASPTAPGGVAGIALTAEPAVVAPEFLPSPFCQRLTPFGARFTVVARPRHDVVIRVRRFQFIDRFGGRTAPSVFLLGGPALGSPGPSLSSPIPIPSSSPIPLPHTSPIPIPGGAGLDAFAIAGGGARTLPFLLQFGCGVPPNGTVFIDVDVSGRGGAPQTLQLGVRIEE